MNKKAVIPLLMFSAGLALGIVCPRHPAPVAAPALYGAEAYFSPNGGIKNHIIKAIDESGMSIDLAVFNITSRDLDAALERAKGRGVKIRMITDLGQSAEGHSTIHALIDKGFNVKMPRNNDRGIMHNKFAIFDGKQLLTGSYNWTYNAERYNYENAVFISDPEIVKEYQKAFDAIWNRS